MNAGNEYNHDKSSAHTESVWCPFCFGSGLRRHRAHAIDPRITIKTCTRCKGRKKIWVGKDSFLWKKSRGILPSLWPGIRKSKL